MRLHAIVLNDVTWTTLSQLRDGPLISRARFVVYGHQ
jgi:hypothetical protein